MAYQLPQFIETEDRPVPFLTWRQLLYFVAAGAIALIAYYTMPFWAALTIALWTFAVAIAFGFVKISGRPLHSVFLAMIQYMWNPRKYYWRKNKNTYD